MGTLALVLLAPLRAKTRPDRLSTHFEYANYTMEFNTANGKTTAKAVVKATMPPSCVHQTIRDGRDTSGAFGGPTMQKVWPRVPLVRIQEAVPRHARQEADSA